MTSCTARRSGSARSATRSSKPLPASGPRTSTSALTRFARRAGSVRSRTRRATSPRCLDRGAGASTASRTSSSGVSCRSSSASSAGCASSTRAPAVPLWRQHGPGSWLAQAGDDGESHLPGYLRRSHLEFDPGRRNQVVAHAGTPVCTDPDCGRQRSASHRRIGLLQAQAARENPGTLPAGLPMGVHPLHMWPVRTIVGQAIQPTASVLPSVRGDRRPISSGPVQEHSPIRPGRAALIWVSTFTAGVIDHEASGHSGGRHLDDRPEPDQRGAAEGRRAPGRARWNAARRVLQQGRRNRAGPGPASWRSVRRGALPGGDALLQRRRHAPPGGGRAVPLRLQPRGVHRPQPGRPDQQPGGAAQGVCRPHSRGIRALPGP